MRTNVTKPPTVDQQPNVIATEGWRGCRGVVDLNGELVIYDPQYLEIGRYASDAWLSFEVINADED